jgi:hypothetical protein
VNESTAGGAATNVGVSFQNRVAAWICVWILTGRDAAPLWGLPAGTALDFLRCETEQPVDDILVGTSKRGNIFIQVKHPVRLERDAASGIGSAIHQFVRQFVTSMARAVGTRPWERPFDLDKDRLVLLVGSKTSAAIIDTLPAILARVPNLAPGQPVVDAATTQAERQTWDTVLTHVGRAWKRSLVPSQTIWTCASCYALYASTTWTSMPMVKANERLSTPSPLSPLRRIRLHQFSPGRL